MAVRLDIALVEAGLAATRSRAQSLIKAGCVYYDGSETALDKASLLIDNPQALRVEGQDHPWVSRGGLKLEHALKHFPINVKGRCCLDVGASTGGFTDVLLHYGAAKVYAVDVGHDQLVTKLKNHPSVISLEGLNARALTRQHIPDSIDLLVCDASFISLTLVLEAALTLLSDNAELLVLVKPQFEVGKDKIGKNGVVKDPLLHDFACTKIRTWLETEKGWIVKDIIPSPITGPSGNREFLLWASKVKY